MKNNINKYIKAVVFLTLSITMFSCVDDITLDFPAYETKIVVEGMIEQGDVARVFLSHSQGYFESIGSDSVDVEINGFTVTLPEFLAKTLVIDATVTVNDGIKTDTLQLGFNQYIFPYLTYFGSSIIGEPGGVYTLKVETDGKVLTSVTTIPNPVPIDSLWYEPRNEHEDSIGYIKGFFSDPAEETNYYRVFTKTIGRDTNWVHPFNSVWPDRNFNGKEDQLFMVYHGDNHMENPEDKAKFYFRIGETVLVKLCAIDYDQYRFWNTYQQNAGGGGNPFASPVPTETNIEGGLGTWGGYGIFIKEYTVSLDSITVK